ncbi:MAG: DUF3127 domain-containing protein [Flavobacteriales bacterium]|jgi:hypothetical protein|nr:DUF3127 domain-containing protein [Flavobacteriales bacterium]
MSYTAKGKVLRVGEIIQVSDTFKKREIVIETDEQYPQILSFEFNQDKVHILNEYIKDDLVSIDFSIRGREWQKDQESPKQVFHTLSAWKIKKQSHEESQSNE